MAEDFGWDDEVFLSFLPLSHAYEHTGGQFCLSAWAAQIYYAEGLEKLAANIEEVRPTMMVVVPRLFEVLRARVMKTIEKQGRVANYLMGRALGSDAKKAGGQAGRAAGSADPPVPDRTHDASPRYSARFGGRIKAMVSGGAPLNPDVGVFLRRDGPDHAARLWPDRGGAGDLGARARDVGLAMDTVGPPLKGVEVKIAEDGEILCAANS
jgi:long-chain acyl-CoA synthetase